MLPIGSNASPAFLNRTPEPMAGPPAPAVTNALSAISAFTAAPGDGVRNAWYGGGTAAMNPGANGAGSFGAGGGFFGLMNNLIGQLGALINHYNEAGTEGPASQSVVNATFASTGDPHLSESGTLASGTTTSPVNTQFNSMTAHDNLLSSTDVAGGYRLSTTVTTPNAAGVTANASATVHLNDDGDGVTLRNDGTYSIVSGGSNVTLGAGDTLQLAGGADVTRDTDGALHVETTTTTGGTIDTTLRAGGGGVDAVAAVTNATVGGDIAASATNPPAIPHRVVT